MKFVKCIAWIGLWCGCFATTARTQERQADYVFEGGKIITCDASMTIAESMAIHRGKIVFVGSAAESKKWGGPDTHRIDLQGGSLVPGFCDSHLHFSALGESLVNIDLGEAKSWDAIIGLIEAEAKKVPPGTWIEGRGWHQAKWRELPKQVWEGYPTHHDLSVRVPDHPVVLVHASGHASFINAKAMQVSAIDERTENPDGGEIVRDGEGKPTGLLRENAQGLVGRARQRTLKKDDGQWERSIERATQECLKYGITSVHDAGIGFAECDRLASLADQKKLGVRVYAMIRAGSGELLQKMPRYRWIERGDGFLTVRSVKVSADGALGPHGAWLLEPYDDLPTTSGLNTVAMDELRKIAGLCKRNQWQLCVHAIGDKANRETLNAFAEVLGEDAQRDHRWRIEHAQHIHPADQPRFHQLGVIPVMQAIHCPSDAVFVMQRLGERRASENAYRWRALIEHGSIVPNGTDAPVEKVDPRASLYASVSRRLKDGPAFFPEQSLTRNEALWSYTLWPAMAAFQEKVRGSLEVGKDADCAWWDRDLLQCAPEELVQARVNKVWVQGSPR